ncbi:Piwi-domain-containing protein [Hypoxylon sp. NC0597]|nr:Piwi-domain-containing protein [Hypoxylon sp. NC0597]
MAFSGRGGDRKGNETVSKGRPDQGSSGGVVGIPRRPGYGTQGNAIKLRANYVPLGVGRITLYRYEISFKDEDTKPPGKKLARVINLALKKLTVKEKAEENNKEDESNKAFAKVVTDFSGILIACEKISDQSTTIQYFDEVEGQPREGATKYQIEIKFQKELSVSDLLNYINTPTEAYEKEQTVQALNIFLNNYPNLSENHVTIGPGKCYEFNKGDIDQVDLNRGLIAVKGYYSSISIGTLGILANINVSFAAFHSPGNLKKAMDDYTGGNYRDADLIRELGKLLRTLRIKRTESIRGKMAPKAMTIFDLASRDDGIPVKDKRPPVVERYGAKAKEVKFWDENKYISVFDFFREKYKLAIDATLPVVNVGTRQNPTYLPAEHCEVLQGQKVKINLDHVEKVKKMTKVAVRNPWFNASDIEGLGLQAIGLRGGGYKQKERLENFKLSIPKKAQLVTVNGRILSPPAIRYYTGNTPVGTKWNLRDVTLGNYSKKLSFVVIKETGIDSNFNDQKIKYIRGRLKIQGITTNGRNIPETIIVESSTKAPEEALKRVFGNKTDDADCILVVLPNSSSPIYNCVKRLADRAYGVPTVCVVKTTETGPEVIGNLALKLNLKFKKNNQALNSKPLSEILNLERTMIVGIDVTHSPEQGAPSIAGMVASVDKYLGQWPAVLRRQRESRQEMVTHLGEMLETRLQLWKTKNSSYPENILVYRDGVSEGQYKVVRNDELPKLEQACKKVYGNKTMPKITIVIVAKRHHTRFFEGKYNPPPGTVVDRGVTDVLYWDFFLQPHRPVMGTVRPTHYFVVHDQIFREKYEKDPANKLEAFTHGLCFMFGRTTNAVSICTPAYYADIACNRARCYVADTESNSRASQTQAARVGLKRDEPTGSEGLLVHPNLRDTMFYI